MENQKGVLGGVRYVYLNDWIDISGNVVNKCTREQEMMDLKKYYDDRKIKLMATKKEYKRVYDNMNLPPRDIEAECSDGRWIRRAWTGLNIFGWNRWEKTQ
jgi:hypothetical protein